MALNYEQLAKKLLELVGGKNNVDSVSHCATRLRFVLKDNNKVNRPELEGTSGVIRLVEQGGQVQVVIGNEVSHVYNEISKLGTFSDVDNKKNENVEKEGIFSRICGFISGCMTPLLPAMLGCGMISVVLTILTTAGLIGTENTTYTILTAVGNTFIFFLPIMFAYTAGKRMGMNPFVAMTVGGVLVHPEIATLLGSNQAVTMFGLPVTSVTYSSSLLPILMMVPIMAQIEKIADKISPNMLKIFLTPLIVIFVSVPIALIVIGPLGTIIGNYLATFITFLYSKAGWLTIMLLSALMPFIIMTGMHYALMPLFVLSMSSFGYDALVVVAMVCSNVAQGAASLAVAAKTKDKDIKSTAAACGVSAAIAGVTEPALYGITLKYKTPLIGAMIGAASAGLYAGLTGLKAYAMGGAASVLALIQMIGGDGMGNLINGIIAVLISLGVAFLATLVLYKDKNQMKEIDEEETVDKKDVPLVERIEVASPISGKAVPLKEVSDETFASGAIGDGLAIIPSDGKVFAPADGRIEVLMDSKHAIGFVTDTGVEMLIHVGIDTVELNGEYFTVHCKIGDLVKKGDLLLEFDTQAIKKKGYDIITPIIITNTLNYVSIKGTEEGTINNGDNLLTIV